MVLLAARKLPFSTFTLTLTDAVSPSHPSVMPCSSRATSHTVLKSRSRGVGSVPKGYFGGRIPTSRRR